SAELDSRHQPLPTLRSLVAGIRPEGHERHESFFFSFSPEYKESFSCLSWFSWRAPRVSDQATQSTLLRHLAHDRQHVARRIAKKSHPQIRVRQTRDDVRRGLEDDAARDQHRRRLLDVVDRVVEDRGELLPGHAPLLLRQRQHQPHAAAVEERQRRRRLEQELHPQQVAIERHRLRQIAHGHGNLPDSRQPEVFSHRRHRALLLRHGFTPTGVYYLATLTIYLAYATINMQPLKSRSRRTARDRSVAERLHSAAIQLLRRLRRQDIAMGLTPARASALSIMVFGG